MSESLRGLLQTVANPFAQVRVDNAWDAVTDVAAINREAFAACLRVIEDVRRGSGAHGLLLSGRPGSGKTHLLARLRAELTAGGNAWFVYVLPVTAPDRFFRHVLQALAGDVLRVPRDGAPTQAEIALARRLARAVPSGTAGTPAPFWETLRQRHASAPDLLDALRCAAEPAAEQHDLDAAVLDVLLQFVARVHRPEARAWLLGRGVTEQQAERLGVAETLDSEEAAQRAVVTLLRLAGGECPAVLTFDQIEGLQRDRSDTHSLMSFAHGVSELFARCPNLAVVTCAQVAFLDDLRQAVGAALYNGRLAERQGSLAVLDGEQAVALASARLSASDDLQSVKRLAQHKGWRFGDLTDPLWPLATDAVRLLALPGDRGARDVMQGCREKFEELRGAAVPAGRPDGLRAVWDEAFEQELRTPRDVIDEGVYEDGLLRVCDVVAGRAVRGEHASHRDVNLVLHTPRGRTAVAVCHAENMTSLAGRLRRLDQALKQHELERLVVLRDQRLPISSTARATRGYLDSLVAQGAAVVRPPAEAYAALSAIRKLLAGAAAGDLTDDGRTVAPEDLKTWLAANLPLVVRELYEQVAGPASEAEPDGQARLLDVLRAERVVDLETAAARAALTPDAARGLAQQLPQLVGHVQGAPEVLFLHPDAVERR